MQLTAAIVGPAHGLRGEVIVDVRSDDPEVMAPGSRLDIAGDQRSLTVRSVRVHKDRVLASFEECSTREEAEALRGSRLLVDAAMLTGSPIPQIVRMQLHKPGVLRLAHQRQAEGREIVRENRDEIEAHGVSRPRAPTPHHRRTGREVRR